MPVSCYLAGIISLNCPLFLELHVFTFFFKMFTRLHFNKPAIEITSLTKPISWGTSNLCCCLSFAAVAGTRSPLKWMRQVIIKDLFPLPCFCLVYSSHSAYLAQASSHFRKQLVVSENKLCHLRLSSKETNGWLGEMSRAMKGTWCLYS